MSSGSSRGDGEMDLGGTDLGPFRDLREIGAGGMGVVYRAVDSRLKRPVALKFLPPAVASDPERLARFEREAETVAALNHPNIVTIYSVEEAAGHRFISMELVEGRSLDRSIPSRGLPVNELLDIAVPLADAVSAAHESQIVHRDLKPANVMLTSRGLVKVLDFGLAKLFSDDEEEPSDHDESALTVPRLTRDGAIAGTPGYMSPEQLRGETVDHRTDIFALGILLYEMATGSRPFEGESAMDVASSILRDDPPSLTDVRDQLPRHLGRIVSQCLEKDPDRRLQSAKDLRNQLAGLRTELESDRILERSASRTTAPPVSPRRSRAVLWGGLILLGLLAIALVLTTTRSEERRSPDPAVAAPAPEAPATLPRSLAVLPFQNLTGDPATDWLRAGLPEMLSTALAESPAVAVLPGRRGQQILAALEEDAAAEPSDEALRRFASETGVSSLLRGSFVKLDGRYRIDLRIEEAATGRVLLSEQAEGEGDAAIFPMVDRLSREVLRRLVPEVTAERSPDSGIAEVTTDSMEAFRYYSEGVRLRNEIKRRESLVMFEKAVELDPGFAMALSAIGTVHLNLGDEAKAREYARRAFENSARAPARERFFLQGRFLSMEWATYGQAIDALQRTVDQYPDHTSARNILANRLTALGDYQRAIGHVERLVSESPDYAGNVWLLSSLYAAEGRFDDARAVIAAYRERNPDNWYGDFLAGLLLLRRDETDAALAALESADVKRPGTNEVRELRWAAFVQSDRWAEAESEARAQLASDDPYYQWAGQVYLARSRLYRGRSLEALEALRAATSVFDAEGPLAGLGLAWSADLELQRGDPAAALEAALGAQAAGRGQWPELIGLFQAALALEELGRPGEADAAAAELARRADRYPNTVESRLGAHLSGLLARSRGSTEEALDQLARAAALLPPRGLFYMDRHRQLPDHTPLWYSLATTLSAAGRSDEAAAWFERIVGQRVESRNFPVRFGRSLYLLARIREEQGRADEARELYRRFADLWAEGDLDREQVAAAREKSG